jgi:hypothetical protein
MSFALPRQPGRVSTGSVLEALVESVQQAGIDVEGGTKTERQGFSDPG